MGATKLPGVPTPPVPDIARARGETVREMVEWWVDYFNTESAPFNYRRSTRAVHGGYRGLHKLHLLTAGCLAEKTAVGRISNVEVVTLAAPLAFDRKTQVFNLTPRRFQFGQNRSAAYRIPFLFVENGVIKLYFLQPRKGAGLDQDEFGMVGTIVKKYLLDTEFYGQRYDVEFVDVSAPDKKSCRILRRYTLSDLKLWSDKRLEQQLTLISESLDVAVASGRIARRHRAAHRPEPDMPLFD